MEIEAPTEQGEASMGDQSSSPNVCPADLAIGAISKNIEYYSDAIRRERRALHFYLGLGRTLFLIAMIAGLAITFHMESWAPFLGVDGKDGGALPFIAAVAAGGGFLISRFVEARGFLRAWVRYSVAHGKLTSIHDLMIIELMGFADQKSPECLEFCVKRTREARDIVEEETAAFAADAHADFSKLIKILEQYQSDQKHSKT